MATISRQSVKVSARARQLLRVLAAVDGRSQAEIAEDAITDYVANHKKQLKSRLGDVQRLLDSGGSRAVSKDWGSRAATRVRARR